MLCVSDVSPGNQGNTELCRHVIIVCENGTRQVPRRLRTRRGPFGFASAKEDQAREASWAGTVFTEEGELPAPDTGAWEHPW